MQRSTEDELVRSFYEVPGRILHIREGEYLFREGDEALHFYFVRQGKLDIHKVVDSGKILSLRLATKNSIIGELPIYQESDRQYIFDAVAKEASEIYAIEYTVLERYLEKKPHLAVNMLRLLGIHMRKQHSKFRDLLMYGKKGALYSTLIRMANSYGFETPDGIEIPLHLTNQELANYSAMTRESLNRNLQELRRQDIIYYDKHNMVIKDMRFLREAINCLGCPKDICTIE